MDYITLHNVNYISQPLEKEVLALGDLNEVNRGPQEVVLPKLLKERIKQRVSKRILPRTTLRNCPP